MLLPPSSPTLMSGVGSPAPAPATTAGNPLSATFAFNIANGANAFFGVLDAMREDDLAKIIGGTQANDHAAAIPLPSGREDRSISSRTDRDWRPAAYSQRTELNSTSCRSCWATGESGWTSGPRSVNPTQANPRQFQPAVKDRECGHGHRDSRRGRPWPLRGWCRAASSASDSGLPWISEVPYLGAAFRKVHEQTNEVELLILVTPELVEPLDASEVPPCGPGTQTDQPQRLGIVS